MNVIALTFEARTTKIFRVDSRVLHLESVVVGLSHEIRMGVNGSESESVREKVITLCIIKCLVHG